MKKILIIIICLLLVGCSIEPIIIGDAVSFSAEYVTVPENNTYKIGVNNFNDEFKADITDERPLQYKLDNKFISFKPTRMYFDGLTVSTKLVETSLKTTNTAYESVFGEGIDLKMNIGQRVWEKLVTINSLKDLGTIPPTAENLIIEFEIESDFIIDGWDRKTDLEIVDKIRLGDFSYIEQASVWDGYSSTTCSMVQFDNVCDESCTQEDEIATGCDYCDPPQEECETTNHRQRVKTVLSENNGKYYFSKEIPVDWLKSAQYPVMTDADVTYGTATVFEAGGAVYNVEVAKLSTGNFAVCYVDLSNCSDGTCRPASVSGTTITFGAESDYEIDDSYVGSIAPACAVNRDTDKIAVGWSNDTDADDGYTRVGTVTYPGGVPTFGSWGLEKEFETDDTEAIQCASTATNAYTICYNDEIDSDTGKCVANTVLGTTVTSGTPTAYDGGTTDYHPTYGDMTSPATNKFVSCFIHFDQPSNDVECYVATVATRTITFGAVSEPPFGTECSYSENPHIGLTSFGTDEIVAAYCEDDDDDGYSAAATISTRTLTWGAHTIHQNGATQDSRYNKLDAISATEYIVGFDDAGDPKGQTNYCTVDWGDSSIICSTPETFEAGSTGGTRDNAFALVSIDGAKIVICYQDDDDSDYGKCIIGDVAAEEVITEQTGCWYDESIGGDWYIESSDNCYTTTTEWVIGEVFIQNQGGKGSYNLIDGGNLNCQALHNTSSPINAEPGTQINFWTPI